MLNLINFIEELQMNAHPAIKTYVYDSWVLRFANGGNSNRSNSVNMPYLSELPSSIPINEKIKFCEDWYAAQGLKTVFKMTPASPHYMDDILCEKGYGVITPTYVMTKHLEENINISANIIFSDRINEQWLEANYKLNGIFGETEVETEKIIKMNIQNELICGIIEINGTTAACGLCVIEREWAGLFNIAVAPEYRGKGYGIGLCGGLLNAASEKGAKNAYLQVVSVNSPANALYRKLGFDILYRYWYRAKDLRTV